MSTWLAVANSADVPAGTRLSVTFNDMQVIIINTGQQLLAVEDKCTHDDGPLADGEIEDNTIVCARHGARFCLRTGHVLEPPAYEAITTFAVRIEGNKILVNYSN